MRRRVHRHGQPSGWLGRRSPRERCHAEASDARADGTPACGSEPALGRPDSVLAFRRTQKCGAARGEADRDARNVAQQSCGHACRRRLPPWQTSAPARRPSERAPARKDAPDLTSAAGELVARSGRAARGNSRHGCERAAIRARQLFYAAVGITARTNSAPCSRRRRSSEPRRVGCPMIRLEGPRNVGPPRRSGAGSGGGHGREPPSSGH